MVEPDDEKPRLSGVAEAPPEPEYDVDALHAAIMRERTEPSEGREPLSVGLVLLFFGLLGWGGWYLGKYGANFDPNVLESSDLGELRATVGAPTETDEGASGERIYNFCSACHGADGQGVPQQYPPLAGSERLTGPPEVPIRIVLDGFGGRMVAQGETYDSRMPGFRDRLTDEQIAAVLTYERSTYGNQAPPVAADEVTRVREETAGRSSAWTAEELDALPQGDGANQGSPP